MSNKKRVYTMAIEVIEDIPSDDLFTDIQMAHHIKQGVTFALNAIGLKVTKFEVSRRKKVKESKCPLCGKEIDTMMEFRDELSMREHAVSGLCQKCQDEVFGKGKEKSYES